ncbi:carboxypeptidase-like regulatory domain-containing protein [Galbibacter mesophilus]|uniref:carboxypeptidase-like regulatory domain-containing protein n=1 Tax=Galbibacter mesophilus TaxID=379069 RepID=UPI00191EA1FD|nr:carboxypeptidase-like regulatory domain-containing protein [Galbibacter mesophilus]MCM5664418.1 carboxypeptidase-like regulatory domain-containing protein [Galbibacter mesophilus]
MKHLYLSILSLFIFTGTIFSQTTISAKIIDSTTNEPIPFATISVNDKSGVISSESGEFSLHISSEVTASDSLLISCLGYEEKKFAAQDFNQELIRLQTKDIELDEVVLLNKNYTVDEIIEKVEDSLEKNYDQDFIKQKIFYRSADHTTILDNHIKIKESTIPEINQAFTDSILQTIPQNTSYYTEILADFYGRVKEDEQTVKLDIKKASELYDKNNQLSFSAIEDKLQKIMRKHVKRDSYFKIKSGIIGTKSEIDSSLFEDEALDTLAEQRMKKEEERKKNFLSYRAGQLNSLLKDNFLYEDSDLNFIHKSRKYDFELDGLLYLQEDLVYKIIFRPSGGPDYKGVMYVNAYDFAVIRLEYENVKPVKKFNLFGVSYYEYLQKGIFLYTKNNRDKYVLKYQEETKGQKVGFDRPFKIIEKNKNVKGRRKQNEVSTHVDLTIQNIEKFELVVFENETINKEDYEAFTPEADVMPVYLPNYNPEFWKGYNIIPPNDAIKEFTSLPEESQNE